MKQMELDMRLVFGIKRGTPQFLTHVCQEAIPKTKLYRLLKDFVVYSGVADGVIVCPKGMIADEESFPIKSSDEAGWVHDTLYRKDGVVFHVNGYVKMPQLSRRKADAVFDEISKLDNVSNWFSWTKWLVVRVLGYNSWHKLNMLDDLETVKKVLG
jgi:hypothetical protein